VPDVIIPVLDEEAALPTLLASMPAGYRAIVVDNASTDASATVARRSGATVIFEPRRGFGAACWAGLNAANPADGVVCFMDGDGSLDPRDLVRVAGPVLRDEAHLVLGARRPAARGAWPVGARLGNRIVVTQVRRRAGVRLRDLGPLRAARQRDLLELGIVDRRFGWALEMVLRAAAAGWVIAEVPVVYRPRIGRSKVTGTFRGAARAAWDMTRVQRAVW
jgi:glycosyltransferase involved in cell wall biosynthesis